MSFQLKYYLEFRTLKIGNTDLHSVEFWQNTTEVLVAEEIKGAQSPFLIEMPDLSHKFQVVRGRGCTLNLFSDTDMKFFAGLEHIDFQEFKIIYKVAGVQKWTGYLNADMQSEPYDINFNYIITTSGNDGFSLLDRFRFLQSDETNYVGLKSKWEILQICLNKIGLTYSDIRVKLATTFTGYSGDADKTILHESFVNCANFYDEDGLAMTMREVIETILSPYGAFICQDNGSIYISDIHTMAGGGSVSFQRFNASTYAYVSTTAETIEKTVTSISYFGTGHSIERSGGTNMQRVVYSPYPVKELIPESIVTPDEFTIVPTSFSDKDGYKYKTLQGHPYWKEERILSLTSFEESCKTEADEHFIYFRYVVGGTSLPVLSVNDPNDFINYIVGAKRMNTASTGSRLTKRYLDGVAVLLTGKVLTKMFVNPYGTGTGTELTLKNEQVVKLGLRYTCSVGSWYYNAATGLFDSTSPVDNYLYTTKQDNGFISNQFVEIGIGGEGLLMKLQTAYTDFLFDGAFNFIVYTDTFSQKAGQNVAANAPLEVWLSNIEVRLVNLDGSEIEDFDSEYTGQLNKLFSQEGEEITLKTGTQSKFSDRGMIIKPDGDGYLAIEQWTRAAQTYKIEELLLNSLCSNYRMNYITLLNMNLKNEFGMMNVLTDSAYIGTKKLMVKSMVMDIANYTNTATLVEITPDELTIVKN